MFAFKRRAMLGNPGNSKGEKIALLVPSMRCGGLERVSLDLAREFCRLGHAPHLVLSRPEGELLPEALETCPVYPLHSTTRGSLALALARHLRQQRPQAILVPNTLVVEALIARRLSGHTCRVVAAQHSLHESWRHRRHRWRRAAYLLAYHLMLPHACAHIAVSQGVALNMAQLSALSPDAITIINNPVTERPPPSPASVVRAESLWPGPPGSRILTVARLAPVKNHELLLRAMARMNDLEAHLMIVGTGELEAPLRRIAADLGIGRRVVFAGYQPEPTAFYDSADLFVLPSDSEGFGNVIVEALARGLPVVATDCPGGPREILEGGRWGRLVPMRDEAALARAMRETLLEVPDRQALRGRAALFDLKTAAHQYLALLQGRVWTPWVIPVKPDDLAVLQPKRLNA